MRHCSHIYCARIFIGGWSSAVTNATVDILARKCKYLESLSLSSCQKLSGSNLKTITDACTSLHKLDLSAISVSQNSFHSE